MSSIGRMVVKEIRRVDYPSLLWGCGDTCVSNGKIKKPSKGSFSFYIVMKRKLLCRKLLKSFYIKEVFTKISFFLNSLP